MRHSRWPVGSAPSIPVWCLSTNSADGYLLLDAIGFEMPDECRSSAKE